MDPSLEDPIALYDAAQKAAATTERDYHRATRALFNTVRGRKWLGMAMARTNFMGSVFSAEDGMNPSNAAHRDGTRAFISEILNSCYAGKSTTPDPDEPDE